MYTFWINIWIQAIDIKVDLLHFLFLFLLHSLGCSKLLWLHHRSVTECLLCHPSHLWCPSVPHWGTASAVASWCWEAGRVCPRSCFTASGKPRPCHSGLCRGRRACSDGHRSAGNPGPAGKPAGGAGRGDGARLADLLRCGKVAA